MLRYLPLALLLISTGCETTPVHELSYSEQKKWAEGLEKKCADQGFDRSHPEFVKCFRAEGYKNIAERENNRRGIQAAAEGFSRGMDSYNRAAYQNRPIHCTSNTYMRGRVSTTCY